MIVDSSAIMALLLDEPEKPQMLHAMAAAAGLTLSGGSWVELSAVLTRRGAAALFPTLEQTVQSFAIGVSAVTIEQARLAHDAYRQFGIGSGHKAKLNFGDCFSYALAKATGEPLLFKGDDFTHTDVVRAITDT